MTKASKSNMFEKSAAEEPFLATMGSTEPFGAVGSSISVDNVSFTMQDPAYISTQYDVNQETVDHPDHYGGADNPYEAIKVIRAWDLGFSLGNTVKYISRAGKKDPNKRLEDLQKALWYLEEEIQYEFAKSLGPRSGY